MNILQDEASLDEIVRLVGVDALSDNDRLTMETAKQIREDYLHQNAFHEIDTYSSLRKQYLMMKLIISGYELGKDALSKGVDLDSILNLSIRESVGRAKYIVENELDKLEELIKAQKKDISALINVGGNN